MFTGIVEEQGIVKQLILKKNLCVLKVQAKKVVKGIKAGDSIAVNGVCLTATSMQRGTITFDIMQETILRTTLHNVRQGSRVNLERALKKNDRLSGHFVTGHVDVAATVAARMEKPNYVELRVIVPNALKRYFVPKGSVNVDGVSLTVGEVGKNYFSTYLIPFTRKATTLGKIRVGDKVNIETDILAKYVLNS